MKAKMDEPIYARIRGILESAHSSAARSVNTAQVVANWLIGREIVEEQQRGKGRAGYGERLLAGLERRLKRDYGGGFSVSALQYMRAFYLTYPALIAKQHAPRVVLAARRARAAKIQHAVRVELDVVRSAEMQSSKSWKPGTLHPSLSWTHYRVLLRVEKAPAKAFYEIEAIQNGWSARQLERQINSLLYERLALSRDKKGLLRLAQKGQEVQKPTDVFKDPLIMEFLGLPESRRLAETDLEQALVADLQAFLLELGRGFAFVARQQRITLDGDHFYLDLVFYHAILKCYVLIDLKVGKLTHQDIGQMQLYVNYYDRRRRSEGDNPTLGLILCTDKNDAVVKYTLGEDDKNKIFAGRYKLHVPTEAELVAEVRRELKLLQSGGLAP